MKGKKFCSRVLMMSLCALIAALISVVMLSAHSAHAQGYPTRPVEIVVQWGAGTSIDLMARLIADIGPKYLGQPILVVNKPGGGGSLAPADVVASKPDGYKLFATNHSYFAGTVHTQKLPFDPKDLVPLANFVDSKLGMFVRADSPFKTFNDLLQYARKNPGQLKWAHVGRGITVHLAPMLIFKKEGLSTIDLPYKGGAGETLAALLGGHVDMASLAYSSVVDQAKAGKIRFLMYYSDERYKDSPNVPSIEELGYPQAVLPAFTGLYIHKNTPEHIKKILMEACKKIYDDPAFKKGLEKINVDPKWGGPDEMNKWIKKSEVIQAPILKELGLYVGK